jgi:putative ubiquitin-RnfH superfamily antitoxin RatB of RatAB toxin-antitoxin module
MPELLHVEIVYADPQRQLLRKVEIAVGASAQEAVEASGILHEVEIAGLRIGIFGREVAATTLLRDGDRVEIYRPLSIDPKEARRKRARAQR